MNTQSKRTELQKLLDDQIPASAVSQREGGSGRMLDYLEGQYVINRLNQVLGQGNWSYKTQSLNLVHSGKITDKYGKEKHTVHYIAQVELVANLEDRQIVFSDVGYGDGFDKENIGKAHELAVKEAVTDAVKRCAKNLGQSMGLALYDKTKQNVRDDSQDSQDTTGNVETQQAQAKPVSTRGKKQETQAQSGASAPNPEDSELRNNLNRINAASRVLMAKKNLAVEELVGRMQKQYGVDKKELLTPIQAKEFADTLTSETTTA